MRRLVVALFLPLAALHADEHLFGYAYTAEVIPQGRFGLIQTVGLREGKKGGDYTAFDFVSEAEYGLTHRLNAFCALVNFHHDHSGLEDTRTFARPRDSFAYGGWDLGAKWMILSPYKDPVGLAFKPQLERRETARLDGSSIGQWSVRAGIALHKNFFDDTLVTAFDYVVAAERRDSAGPALEEQLSHEILAGATYRFAPNWFVGLETRYQTDYRDLSSADPATRADGRVVFNDLDDLSGGRQYQWAWYAGPSLHYGARRFWVTAAMLWQLAGSEDEDPAFARFGDPRHQERHEAWHLRLKVGFPL